MATIDTKRNALISGQLAEALVATLLERQGWNIVRRNYRRPSFELDLVAEKAKTLVVVEVKSRRQHQQATDLAQLVSASKKKALLRGLAQLISTLPRLYETIRIDLAVAETNKAGQIINIRYYPGAIEIPAELDC